MAYDNQSYPLHLFVSLINGVGLTVFCKIWYPQICFWKWVCTKFSCLLVSAATRTWSTHTKYPDHKNRI